MEILKLPIKTYTVSLEEIDKMESLGLPIDRDLTIDIDLYVNRQHIVAFNEDTSGNTTLYITGQDEPFMVFIEFKEFLKLVQ